MGGRGVTRKAGTAVKGLESSAEESGFGAGPNTWRLLGSQHYTQAGGHRISSEPPRETYVATCPDGSRAAACRPGGKGPEKLRPVCMFPARFPSFPDSPLRAFVPIKMKHQCHCDLFSFPLKGLLPLPMKAWSWV